MSRLVAFFAPFLLLSILASAADVLLFSSKALPGGVRLEWAAANEPGVVSYAVDRQDGPADDFDRLANLTASPRARYWYFDKSAHAAATGPLTYRLTVHAASGTHSYLSTPEAEGTLEHSWGLIKQMFR